MPYQRVRIVYVGIYAVKSRQYQKIFRSDEAGDLASRFVVVYALHNLRMAAAQRLYFHFAVLLGAHRIVIVYYRDSSLKRTAQKRRFQMLPFHRVVEVLMLDEKLTERIPRIHESSVGFEQYRLSLRRIVGLDVRVIAFQFVAHAVYVIEPSYLGSARSHPHVTRLKFAAYARYHVIIYVVVGFVDERHRAYLTHQFNIERSHFSDSSRE